MRIDDVHRRAGDVKLDYNALFFGGWTSLRSDELRLRIVGFIPRLPLNVTADTGFLVG